MRLGVLVFLTLLSSFQTHAYCKKQVVETKGFPVQVFQYEPSFYSSTILIMPPINGTNILDREYAMYLCERGFLTLVLDTWKGADASSLDVKIHEKQLSEGQMAIKTVLKEVAVGPVGILGNSLGAIHASTALYRNDELTAGFLIVGGAPLAEVISASKEQGLSTYREQRFEKYGYSSQKEYKNDLASVIKTDPTLEYTRPLDKPLTFVISKNDVTVPTENQYKLARLMQPQKIYVSDQDHVWTVITSLQSRELNSCEQSQGLPV